MDAVLKSFSAFCTFRYNKILLWGSSLIYVWRA